MDVISKIRCGSTELFKHIPNFKTDDVDYLLITDAKEPFRHTHPEDAVCWFIWGGAKEAVKHYVLNLPYYHTAMSLVTKIFVDYYNFSFEEVTKAINRYYSVYENSIYRYYIPLFDYIKDKRSWDFPVDVLNKSYSLYKKFKKGS